MATVASLAVALSGCTGGTTQDTSPPSQSAATSEDWSLSPGDYTRLYDEFVEGLKGQFQLNGPVSPQLVRYVSLQEWPAQQVACLSESGFVATVNAQGGVTYGDVPHDQADSQRRAAAECQAKFPIDPRFNMQLPRKRAELQYTFLVEKVAPCVAGLGYTLTDPPSLQVWLDEYYKSGGGWDPFAQALAQMPDYSAMDDLYKNCPSVSEDVYPSEGGPVSR